MSMLTVLEMKLGSIALRQPILRNFSSYKPIDALFNDSKTVLIFLKVKLSHDDVPDWLSTNTDFAIFRPHLSSHNPVKMPIVHVHAPDSSVRSTSPQNPLPQLLHTPSGLAIVEIQGTIHTPDASNADDDASQLPDTKIGNLEFPNYNENNPEDTAWMKLAYLYVGKNQRMTGQVKKLPKAIAILQRKEIGADDLQITEIIKYKIVFSQRPEPVGQD
jgi:chromosome transmission fidelity protein 8